MTALFTSQNLISSCPQTNVMVYCNNKFSLSLLSFRQRVLMGTNFHSIAPHQFDSSLGEQASSESF